jgi:hypothetical protein
MGKMMGRKAWYKLPCFCCTGPKSKKQVRLKEKRQWQQEAQKIDLTADAIDDRIDAWHDDGGTNLELYEYLGWTKQQYEIWLYTGELVPESFANALVNIPTPYKIQAAFILINKVPIKQRRYHA